ncbi:META domain-containing protein [Blastococcus sp. LR1]|uniref:META domain-containing protein n=1 Tax=Blastococcus sp. LR1 TaxID=2877000 RepID=UPI001CCF2642|nr:META domain-containing protein [Blastococcus sp. LR1]MCA0146123.1 META domain-containing protein [Blastococcus sp. LR1]
MTRTVLLLGVVLAVAACGGGSTGGSPPAQEPGDVRGEWVVTELRRDGEVVPVPPGTDGTLTLDDRLSGRAFCNGFGAQAYRIEGDRLVVEDLAQTLIGCAPEIAELERLYVGALTADDVRLARDGEALLVSGGGVDVRLVPRPPVEDADLAGRWQLTALATRDMASSPMQAAELELRPDGTFSGTTGCRPVRGTWRVTDERLVTADLVADGDCAPETAEQDGHVLDVLRQGGAVRIARDHLTLTAPDGHGLQFTTG